MDPINREMLFTNSPVPNMEGNGNTDQHTEHSSKRSNSITEVNDSLKDLSLNGNEWEDDSFSAPFEILAEFLSSLMSQDYRNALHYCKLILQYEPENVTVQEFHPLIEQKIKIAEAENSYSEDLSEYSEGSCDRDSEDSRYYSSTSNEENIKDEREQNFAVDLSNSEASELDDED